MFITYVPFHYYPCIQVQLFRLQEVFIPLVIQGDCIGVFTSLKEARMKDPQIYGTECLASLGTSSRDNLRQPMIVPVAVDTVVLLMMGVCAARNM